MSANVPFSQAKGRVIKQLLKPNLSFELCLVVSPCGHYKNLNNAKKVRAVLWVSQPCFAISARDIAAVVKLGMLPIMTNAEELFLFHKGVTTTFETRDFHRGFQEPSKSPFLEQKALIKP